MGVVRVTSPPLYHRQKSPRSPLSTRLRGSQSGSRRCGGGKSIVQACLRNSKPASPSAVFLKVRHVSFCCRCVFSLIPFKSPVVARSQPHAKDFSRALCAAQSELIVASDRICRNCAVRIPPLFSSSEPQQSP